MSKLTRQGVRDLGGNFGRRKHRCFGGVMVQVGTRWEYDEAYMEDFEVPIYASKCIHCGRVMGEVV